MKSRRSRRTAERAQRPASLRLCPWKRSSRRGGGRSGSQGARLPVGEHAVSSSGKIAADLHCRVAGSSLHLPSAELPIRIVLRGGVEVELSWCWKPVLSCFGEHGQSSGSPPWVVKGPLGCLQLALPQPVQWSCPPRPGGTLRARLQEQSFQLSTVPAHRPPVTPISS